MRIQTASGAQIEWDRASFYFDGMGFACYLAPAGKRRKGEPRIWWETTTNSVADSVYGRFFGIEFTFDRGR